MKPKPMPKHAKEKFIEMLIKFEAPIRCIEEERKLMEKEIQSNQNKKSHSD